MVQNLLGLRAGQLNQRQIQYRDSSYGEEEKAKDLHNSGDVKFYKLVTVR